MNRETSHSILLFVLRMHSRIHVLIVPQGPGWTALDAPTPLIDTDPLAIRDINASQAAVAVISIGRGGALTLAMGVEFRELET
jgi:hypothetical protein